jgi:hypothetical protein
MHLYIAVDCNSYINFTKYFDFSVITIFNLSVIALSTMFFFKYTINIFNNLCFKIPSLD